MPRPKQLGPVKIINGKPQRCMKCGCYFCRCSNTTRNLNKIADRLSRKKPNA